MLSEQYQLTIAEFSDNDCVREANMTRAKLRGRADAIAWTNGDPVLQLHDALVLVRKRQLELAIAARDSYSIESQQPVRTAITEAVLRRADYRCAWCARKLDASGVVCRLDVLENDSSFVASCRECAGEYAKWWPMAHAYSFESAKRFLGRCPRTGSGPFVDYLEAETKGRGYLLPFNTALARIEAQRNTPLDLRRKVA